jgi:N-carbamoylputrescine amidase
MQHSRCYLISLCPARAAGPYNGTVPTGKFRLGLIQMACSPNLDQNLAKAEAHIRDAAVRGANVICLQELFRSLYFCQEVNADCFNLAEPLDGPTAALLERLAAELDVVLVGSLFERRAPGLYHNTAVVIDAGGKNLGAYRKTHIPDDPLFYEKYYFTPGDLGYRVFSTRYARIAPLVCWDQWYPEAARLAALAGAEVLLYPTAIGWHPSEKATHGEAQYDAWRTIQRAHAIANGVYVAAVNRTGHEGAGDAGIEFWGGSFVADPFGRILAQAEHTEEETLVVECDPALSEETRRNWPFLRDRRIDTYAPLSNRWNG